MLASSPEWGSPVIETHPSIASTSRTTESVSVVTLGLDAGDAAASLRMLAANEGGLFFGCGALPSLLDDAHIETAARVASAMAAALSNPRGGVVFAGAGTSGRLAQFHARALNASWAHARGDGRVPFSYALAGGNAAIVLPQEAAEDSDTAAGEAFDELERAAGHVGGDVGGVGGEAPRVLIGVSCGLSATFVMGLVERALARNSAVRAQSPGAALPWFVCVLGFNPLGALVEPLPHIAALLARLRSEGGELLNPSLGAEALSGSSRLKGGSATSAIVNALAAVAFSSGLSGVAPRAAAVQSAVREHLLDFAATTARTYTYASTSLARLSARAGDALSAVPSAPVPPRNSAAMLEATGAGRLFYIGVGAAGALALTDASECPPTFGALFNAVRAWVVGGWETVLGSAVSPPSLTVPSHLRAAHPEGDAEPVVVDVSSFTTRAVPMLTSADVVIFVAVEGEGDEQDVAQALSALDSARKSGAQTSFILVTCNADASRRAAGDALVERARRAATDADGVIISLPRLSLASEAPLPFALGHLAVKLALNAVSTLAHAASGSLLRGRMVRMSITNAKLFYRAQRITAATAGVSDADALHALLEAIYSMELCEAATASLARAPVGEHVAAACEQRGVLPLAIVIAASVRARNGVRITVAAAKDLLARHVRPRAALEALRDEAKIGPGV